MNVNDNEPVLNLIKNRGRQLKTVPVQRALMGPPKRPAPRRKGYTNSAYTTSTSSHIQWRSQQKSSCQNNSITAHTVSTSRSRSSTEPEARIILALSEGRGEAIGEVGIAAINVAHPSLILCQISDSQSYINTLTKLNILNPSEILIPLTFIESFSSNRLIEKVKEKFHDVKITGVPRNSFNKTNGLQYIKQLCVPSMNSILLVLQHRYYALAAAAALLAYTETTLFIVYASESIKIEYQESEGSTIIDVATADGLELVASARPTMKKRFSCLLDILNHCITKIGARTLRATILQPPCSIPDIEARLDCITELMEHTDMLAAIQASLMKLANIDQLLSLAIVLPDQAQNCSERQLNYVLILNSTLEQITALKTITENSKQPFFIELQNTLNNPIFTDIKNLVRTLIHSDAWPAKGQYGVIQRCFAIKSGVNSLLDLLRKSYSERLDDMREYVKTLGEKYSLALTLNNTHKKGYHILLTLNARQKRTLKKDDLPGEFIQVERLPACYTMKTQDLINLSHRVEDMMLEILKMSNIMIFRLLLQIREHVGIFYKLCEDIAHLDMLQSLARASSAVHYVRPKFSDYLEIEQARHPLLDFLCPVEPTANSVFASKEYNMNIITGPNGSGKSIFIRQIVLLQVMAQVGCYVPALSATLRVSDRILAKVYLEDNMDCGASAFVLEMKEIQYFLNVLTDNSLIVIDELCRSTSVEDGTAIAMAVCERLMKTPAFLFFTTHFKFMTKLEELHYNVKSWQMQTLTETINNQMVLQFTYNVIPGIISLEHYGIFLAKTSWPENIIKYAEKILQELSKSQKELPSSLNNGNEAARLKYNLEAEFKILKTKKLLTQPLINEKLAEYQRGLESLGHQTEQLYVRPLTTQENVNEVEINDDVQVDNLSQILNNQVRITNNAQQINGFEGFNFHSGRSAEIFKNIEEATHQSTSFNNGLATSFISQDYNCDNDFLQNSYGLNNIDDIQNIALGNQAVTMVNNIKFGPFNHNSFLQNITDNSPDNLYPSISQNSLEIIGLNETQNSDFNIFEPEVILQTTTSKLEINFTNVQKDIMTVHKITEQDSFTMFDVNTDNDLSFLNAQSNLYEENLYPSKINSQYTNVTIMEKGKDSFASLENPFLQSDSEFHERCKDAVSVFNSSKQNDTESILSVNENQFSLPLQQNLERTSTPIQIYSEPSIPFVQNRIRSNENSRLKSVSVNSNTVKWGIEKTQNIVSTPTTSSSLKTNEQSSQSQLDADIKKCAMKSKSNKKQLNSTNTNGVNWGIEGFEEINSQSNDLDDSFCNFTESILTSNNKNLKSDLNTSHCTNKKVDYNNSKQLACENQRQINNAIGTNSRISYNDSSIPSVNNEQQFSLPLRQNLERTSTPLQRYSEPIQFTHNETKWRIEEPQNIVSTPTISALKTNKPSIALKNINENKTKETLQNRKSVQNANSGNSKSERSSQHQSTSTNTIQWGKERCQEVNITPSQSKQIVKSNNAISTNSMINYHESSIRSINNEHQFSLPLQQNSKKTSTPLKVNPKVHSEPISYIQKHSNKPADSEILKSKSTSTNSDSIKWKIGKTIDFLATSTAPFTSHLNSVSESTKKSTLSLTMPNINEQSSSEVESHQNRNNSIHSAPEVNKHQSIKKDARKQKNINVPLLENNKSAKSSDGINSKETDSIRWNTKRKSNQNVNNESHYYSAVDVTEIINDLQSYSEYFTDEESWGTLDKESNNNNKNTIQADTPISQSNIIKEQTITNENCIHSQEKYNTFKSSDQKKSKYNSCENQNQERLHTENLSHAMSKDEISHLLEDEVELFEEIELDVPNDKTQQNESNQRNNQFDNSQERACNQNKYSHLKTCTPENQIYDSKRNRNKKDLQINKENVHSQSMKSLEPLGDIHLELFSDESIAEESHNSFNVSKNKKTIDSQSKTKCDIENINTEPQDNSKISNESYTKLLSDVSIIETSQTQNKMQSFNIINHTKQKHCTKDLPKSDENVINNTSNNDTNYQDDINSLPKPKRRKLGYGSRPKATYKESQSSDIGAQSSSLFQVSPRSSDFEIPEDESQNSGALKKKRKWIPPFKPNSNTSTSTSSNPKRIQKKKKHTIPKFKPPGKLTKKEIEHAFYEQDKKMLESEDSGQYIQQLLNRPSVKQVQETKHIMSIHKTSSGIVVVPTKEHKPKIRKRKFIPPLKYQRSGFDVTLFSDKNSDKYEEFMNSKKKEEIVNVRQDLAHEYIRSEVVRKNNINSEAAISNKSSEESGFEKFGEAIQNFKTELVNKNKVPSTSNINNNELLEQSKGYYTQNKERIDNMVNKYLNSEVTSKDFTFTNQDNSQHSSSSIFTQTTMIINKD